MTACARHRADRRRRIRWRLGAAGCGNFDPTRIDFDGRLCSTPRSRCRASARRCSRRACRAWEGVPPRAGQGQSGGRAAAAAERRQHAESQAEAQAEAPSRRPSGQAGRRTAGSGRLQCTVRPHADSSRRREQPTVAPGRRRSASRSSSPVARSAGNSAGGESPELQSPRRRPRCPRDLHLCRVRAA